MEPVAEGLTEEGVFDPPDQAKAWHDGPERALERKGAVKLFDMK